MAKNAHGKTYAANPAAAANAIKLMQVELTEVLNKLGFVQQIDLPLEATQASKVKPSLTESPFKMSAVERNRLIEQNVRLMLEQLTSSNPWVALGLSPTEDLNDGVHQMFPAASSPDKWLSSPNVTLAKDVAHLRFRLRNQHSHAEQLLHYYHHYGTPPEPFSENETITPCARVHTQSPMAPSCSTAL